MGVEGIVLQDAMLLLMAALFIGATFLILPKRLYD
jgi:hypothetical protein